MLRIIFLLNMLMLAVFAAYAVISFPALTAPASVLLLDRPVTQERIIKKRNDENIVIPILITVHPNIKALNKAFSAYYSEKYTKGKLAVGWYGITKGVCEIHVLEILYSKGDPNMTVWGHELTHCVYGTFHTG